MYKLSTNTVDVTESTTLMPAKYGGFIAVNTGTSGVAYIDGYPLNPGEGLDMHDIQPDVIWNSPIKIILSGSAQVRITRFMYVKTKEAAK